MLFNSLQFLVFFIIITIGYFLIGYRYRWLLLLLASCYFYMAFVPVYILILAGTIVIDYFAGILLEQAPDNKRKLVLIISLAANIGVLAVFKYYNFFVHNLSKAMDTVHLHNPLRMLSILLPIGLSFHTFQAMSYTIEVYRRNQKAERHFGLYALYVMYYPQLVAGPIERPQNLLPQFHTAHPFDFERLKSGLMQMAWGFFKKLVIADRLAQVVDFAYTDISHQNGLTLLLATVFYSFQIYCDFSGYSDIAIGASRIMGIDLMTNFKAPYLSASISDFWSRWHISLSTWFKDYLYIPLGGNRVKVPRWFFNLFLVFVISGLWHGANWTFIVWGALHGFYLVFAIIKNKWVSKIQLRFKLPRYLDSFLDVLFTFSLVSFAWIFFRSYNMAWAMKIIAKIGHLNIHDQLLIPINNAELLFSFILIVALLVKERLISVFNTKSSMLFFISFSAFVLVIYLFGIFNQNQFIYFQF